jgi:hypothetical protein
MGFHGGSNGRKKRGWLTVGVNRNESFKETEDHKPCESAELEVIRREKTTSRVAWMGGNRDRVVLLWAALIESIRALQSLKQLHSQTSIFS